VPVADREYLALGTVRTVETVETVETVDTVDTVDTDAADTAAPPVDLNDAVHDALRKMVANRGRRGGVLTEVVAEPGTTLRRTWFDTFDWRLHKAGLTLWLVDSGRSTGVAGARLCLASDADVVSVPPAQQTEVRVGHPFDAVVPAGTLRRRLEPIVEMRALIRLVTLRTAATTYRIVNDDRKTVARVVVERATGGTGASRLGDIAPRVSVVASRGYEADAATAARVVGKIPSLTSADRSMLAQALAAIGRFPGDYSGKLVIALDPDLPTEDAVRRVMRALLDAAQRNVAGVAADIDTEFLHDVRVAVRRGRSALKVTAPALPAAEALAVASALKWLGDLTTPTRDLDVYLLGLDDLAAEVSTPGWNVSQLTPFRDFLVARRTKEHAALVRTLRGSRAKRAFAAWAAASSASPAGPASGSSAASASIPRHATAGPIGAVATAAARRVFTRVIKSGGAIDAASPASDLHELRKRCKELRYTLEIFAGLYDPVAQRALVDDLKKLQDCLGEFQDTEVQQRAIRQFAEDMLAGDRANSATVEAVMAMGRLADRLEERQRIARARFGQLFAVFAGPRPQSHLAALYERAT
jgi:CHAD domain-containing protein